MQTTTTQGVIWRFPSEKAAWYFLTLDAAAREFVTSRKRKRRGWGQIVVIATLGGTSWKTSIFPYKRVGYIFPVKADVRKKEDVGEGDRVKVILEFIGL